MNSKLRYKIAKQLALKCSFASATNSTLKVHKMKVLKYLEIFLRFLGAFSSRDNEATNEFHKSPNSFAVMFFCLSLFLCSYTYIHHHINSLEEIIYAFIPFTGGLAVGIAFLTFGLEMKTTKKVHNELQRIVNDGKEQR